MAVGKDIFTPGPMLQKGLANPQDIGAAMTVHLIQAVSCSMPKAAWIYGPQVVADVDEQNRGSMCWLALSSAMRLLCSRLHPCARRHLSRS